MKSGSRRPMFMLLAFCGAFALTYSSAKSQTDAVWIDSALELGAPCTTRVEVNIRCRNDRPLNDITIPLALANSHWLGGSWTGSKFTGLAVRGERAPEAILDLFVLCFGVDSSSALLILHSSDSFLTVGEGLLCKMEVLAKTHHSLVGLEIFDTALCGSQLRTTDTGGIPEAPEFRRGAIYTVIDSDPPDPFPEFISVSRHTFKRLTYDTIVTCKVRYIVHVSYSEISVPLSLGTGIPGAHLVPGSLRFSEWGDTTGFGDIVISEFADSSGFWVRLLDGPHEPEMIYGQPYDLMYFDVLVPANATGTLYIDSATVLSGDPLNYRDECPDNYPPAFSRGYINVDPASVDEPEYLTPDDIVLSQPFPNPFNPDVSVSLTLAAAERVSLEVFDLLGRHVETLWSQLLAPGFHEFTWSATGQPSGVYFIRAATATQTQVRKALLLK